MFYGYIFIFYVWRILNLHKKNSVHCRTPLKHIDIFIEGCMCIKAFHFWDLLMVFSDIILIVLTLELACHSNICITCCMAWKIHLFKTFWFLKKDKKSSDHYYHVVPCVQPERNTRWDISAQRFPSIWAFFSLPT